MKKDIILLILILLFVALVFILLVVGRTSNFSETTFKQSQSESFNNLNNDTINKYIILQNSFRTQKIIFYALIILFFFLSAFMIYKLKELDKVKKKFKESSKILAQSVNKKTEEFEENIEHLKQKISQDSHKGKDNAIEYKHFETMIEVTVNALISAIEFKDPVTAQHQRNVSQYAVLIGKRMELPEKKIEGLRIAGLLHDIGKLKIPAEILNKTGDLNAAEYQLVKTHVEASYNIVKDIDFPWPVAEIVLQHHENMDGSGYPQGLKGENIITCARILNIADSIDSMTSHRPYHPTKSIKSILFELEEKEKDRYDQDIVAVVKNLVQENNFKLI